MAPDENALVGTILADRYRIEELLGQGGMGTVYRAEHILMKKTVALKVLHHAIASMKDIAARFEREAIAAGHIEHKNVAKAMDFGRLPDGSFYLVIEYVKGKSLTELIQRGPLDPAHALEIASQIADAMDAAHKAGIVHRDLKPDNVMLADGDANGFRVKVLDFGVAKLASEGPTAKGARNLTRVGTIIGTPEYMSPEQAGGSDVDHRADLYALGVILYEMLTGRPPFLSGERIGILAQHLVEPPPPLPDSIPEKVRAIVLELLAKDPSERIQTAAELVTRIDEACGRVEASSPLHPVVARTDVDEPTSAKGSRKRSKFVFLLGATCLLAGSGFGLIVYAKAQTMRRLGMANLMINPITALPASSAAGAAEGAAPAPPPESETAAAVDSAAPVDSATAAAEPGEGTEIVVEEEADTAPPSEPVVVAGPASQTPRKAAAPAKKKPKKYIIRRRVVRRTVTYRR